MYDDKLKVADLPAMATPFPAPPPAAISLDRLSDQEVVYIAAGSFKTRRGKIHALRECCGATAVEITLGDVKKLNLGQGLLCTKTYCVMYHLRKHDKEHAQL